jgi:hypothetical protein
MEKRWWPCPSCRMPVPFSYQIEESFDAEGRAVFDAGGKLAPSPDDESLSACWMRVIRCPNEACDKAWAMTLYPTSKTLFEEEIAAV